ncbi:cysteine desulfurase [Striga asiatica]|uniref:Cysteine desulfurase n=1 Tax=Striga asiatica TaxID=4170 RepID=A0A5A7PK67_STRAF|nr:cysteine desulfurase [Striga asiatica]
MGSRILLDEPITVSDHMAAVQAIGISIYGYSATSNLQKSENWGICLTSPALDLFSKPPVQNFSHILSISTLGQSTSPAAEEFSGEARTHEHMADSHQMRLTKAGHSRLSAGLSRGQADPSHMRPKSFSFR